MTETNKMVVKRRNHGRSKHGKGKAKNVVCALTGKLVSKDKAVKRFVVRNMVESSAMRDIRDASAFETYQLPKVYYKMYYSIDAAVHRRLVRGRSMKERRNRDPPPRFRPKRD